MEELTTSFESFLLRDPDVKFGAGHYELLRAIGAFVQQLRAAELLMGAGGSTLPGSAVINIAGLDEGPSLLTLVRMAHAGGSALVISLGDATDVRKSVEVLRI